jgi:hypothetical protein
MATLPVPVSPEYVSYEEPDETVVEADDPEEEFIPVVVTAARAIRAAEATEYHASMVLARLVSAEISPDRAHDFLAAGAVPVNGKQVTAPGASASRRAGSCW